MRFDQINQTQIEDNPYNKELMRLYDDVFSGNLSESFLEEWVGNEISSRTIRDFIVEYNQRMTPGNAYSVVNPQLITLTEEFMSAPLRGVHFGQETYGWGGEDPVNQGIFNPHLMPNFLMKLYSFYYKDHHGDRNWDYCDDIMTEHPGIKMLHMNILMMGYPYGTKGGYASLNYEVKDITRGILRIVKPHFCIFNTGGKSIEKNGEKIKFGEYDNHIRNVIGEFEITHELRTNNGELLASTLIFKDSAFNFKAIRTGHLNHCFTSEEWRLINNYINTMIISER